MKLIQLSVFYYCQKQSWDIPSSHRLHATVSKPVQRKDQPWLWHRNSSFSARIRYTSDHLPGQVADLLRIHVRMHSGNGVLSSQFWRVLNGILYLSLNSF